MSSLRGMVGESNCILTYTPTDLTRGVLQNADAPHSLQIAIAPISDRCERARNESILGRISMLPGRPFDIDFWLKACGIRIRHGADASDSPGAHQSRTEHYLINCIGREIEVDPVLS